jgi:carbon-monoxide dehydrogenase medium subunit
VSIAHDFDYVRVSTLAEALEALGSGGPGARVLAGGTDMIAWLRDDAVTPGLLVDIKDVPGLDEITVREGTLEIGALVTFSALIASPLVAEHAPTLAEASHTVASVGIRNRATLVGNLCSAVPSLDGGPPLLVHDAVLRVAGPAGERHVPIVEWFAGPRRTALADGEIAVGVSVPLTGDHGGCYVKLSRYRGEDLAQASVAVLATPGNRYRVAFGAVGPVAFRAPGIEAHLEGRVLDDEAVEGARALVDEVISPITDVRATKEYRAHMCRVMLVRALRAAAGRLSGDGPAYGAELL